MTRYEEGGRGRIVYHRHVQHMPGRSCLCGHVRQWNGVMKKAWWLPRRVILVADSHQRKITLGDGGKGHRVAVGTVHPRKKKRKEKKK